MNAPLCSNRRETLSLFAVFPVIEWLTLIDLFAWVTLSQKAYDLNFGVESPIHPTRISLQAPRCISLSQNPDTWDTYSAFVGSPIHHRHLERQTFWIFWIFFGPRPSSSFTHFPTWRFFSEKPMSTLQLISVHIMSDVQSKYSTRAVQDLLRGADARAMSIEIVLVL